MTDLTNFAPTVLLINEFGEDSHLMKNWFETNGYNVRESIDVYDVLEEMTDMSLEQRPGMILFNSYFSAQDCLWVIDSIQDCLNVLDLPIVSLSASENTDDFARPSRQFLRIKNFDSLKPLMQSLLPVRALARAA